MRWTRRIAVVSVFGYAHRRGRAAARPVGRRARRAAEGGRAGRSRLPRHHRPAAAPDGAARDARARRTRAARSPRCETGWRASGTGWRCCCWRRSGSPGRSRCRTATRGCCATSAASSWCVVLARLAQIVILGALDRALAPRPDAVSRYPGIEARLALYHPVLVSIARALIFVAAAIALLQLWGLGTFDWLVASRPWPPHAVQPAHARGHRAAGRGGMGGGQRGGRAASRQARARGAGRHVRRGCARCCRCCAPRCRSPS